MKKNISRTDNFTYNFQIQQVKLSKKKCEHNDPCVLLKSSKNALTLLPIQHRKIAK